MSIIRFLAYVLALQATVVVLAFVGQVLWAVL